MARSRSREDERKGSVEDLIDKVETSLTKFAETAKNAQSETSEHRGAIDAQITELAERAEAAGPQSGRLSG